jgi:hypothetical protein
VGSGRTSMGALSMLKVVSGTRTGRVAAAVAAGLGLLAVGCGASAPASGSCRSAFRWHGRQYLGAALTLKHRLPAAEASISVREPICNDGGDPTNPGRFRSLDVFPYRGIPPSITLGDRSHHPRTMFLSGDSLAISGSHPLHRYLYGAKTSPDYRHGACRPVAAVTGRIPNGPSGGDRFAVRLVSGSLRRYAVDAGTRLNGPVVDGVPRLAPRSRVRVRAVRCSGHRLPLATAITVL